MKQILYASNLKSSITMNYHIQKILDWNDNKDIILWVYNGDIYKKHSKVLYPFSIKHINPNITYDCTIFENNNEFSKFFDNNKDKNVFVAIQYLEDIQDEYIVIKDTWLNDYYCSDVNKRIIAFEIHSNAINDKIIDEWFTSIYNIMGKKNSTS